MTGRVRIFIEGTQLEEDEAGIITRAEGEHCSGKDGHILRYYEPGNDKEAGSDNTVRIAPGRVEMTKKGENSTHMVFDLKKATHSVYDTQYGSLQFQIDTTLIHIEESTNQIILQMEYTLSHYGNSYSKSHISDNRIKIIITAI